MFHGMKADARARLTEFEPENLSFGHRCQIVELKASFWFCIRPGTHLFNNVYQKVSHKVEACVKDSLLEVFYFAVGHDHELCFHLFDSCHLHQFSEQNLCYTVGFLLYTL